MYSRKLSLVYLGFSKTISPLSKSLPIIKLLPDIETPLVLTSYKYKVSFSSLITLLSPSQDSVILLPRDNASSLGLRKLTDKESLKKALSILSSKIEAPSFWKERVERNQSLLKEGSVEALCKIISNLYSRQKIKELPTIEKRLYDNALDMLISEAMSVLKKSEEDIRKIIFSYLENGAEFRFNCNSSRVIS